MSETGPRGGSPFGDPHVLLDLSGLITSSLVVDEVVNRTLEGLRSLVRFRNASIQLIDAGGTVERPEGHLVVPLDHEGQPVGVLRLEPVQPGGLSEHEKDVVNSLAPVIASALQNACTFERERRALVRMQEAQRTKIDLVAIVSHELRTPLAVILGFATAIADNASTLEPQRVVDLARRIIDSGHRLDRLVGDLLDVGTIERGALRVEPVPVSLEEFLHSGLTSAEPAGPHVEVVVEPDLPPVWVDAHRLQQIIDNLIGNVRKFCGPDARAEVSARRNENGGVLVTVADNGPGIDPESLNRVVEPFFQSDQHRAGGLGLGLYLVNELCSAMGGRVEIDSAPGAGTRVTLTLQTVPDEAGTTTNIQAASRKGKS